MIFLKWREFALKVNLNVHFTTYYSLVNAIPRNWKANIKNPIQHVKYHTAVSTLLTSSIYSSILKTIFIRPTAETKTKGFSYAIDSHK